MVGMADAQRNPAEDEPAHDILAAEAFAVPAPDPALRHSMALPEDPAGIAEPHDILAAEEFAMPAPAPGGAGASAAAGDSRSLPRWSWITGACLAVIWARRRRH
jgi:hypothetical protein